MAHRASGDAILVKEVRKRLDARIDERMVLCPCAAGGSNAAKMRDDVVVLDEVVAQLGELLGVDGAVGGPLGSERLVKVAELGEECDGRGERIVDDNHGGEGGRRHHHSAVH